VIKTAADWFIEGLRERGVTWMSTLCGHGLDPLFHAAQQAGLRLVDTRNEQIAVDEARKLKIPVIGVVDTNCDPEQIDFPIPGNDDALRSIRLFASRIADAVIAGRDIKQSSDVDAAREGEEGGDDQGRRGGRAPARRPREAAPASAPASA